MIRFLLFLVRAALIAYLAALAFASSFGRGLVKEGKASPGTMVLLQVMAPVAAIGGVCLYALAPAGFMQAAVAIWLLACMVVFAVFAYRGASRSQAAPEGVDASQDDAKAKSTAVIAAMFAMALLGSWLL